MIIEKPHNRNSVKKPATANQLPDDSKKTINRKRKFSRLTIKNKKLSIGKSITHVLDGSFLTKDNLLKQVPFLVFITILGIFYIANSYNAEKTIIEISRTKKQLEELRYEYITTKASLMFLSKQSEVAYRLSNSEVKESTVPPFKLSNKIAEE